MKAQTDKVLKNHYGRSIKYRSEERDYEHFQRELAWGKPDDYRLAIEELVLRLRRAEKKIEELENEKT